MLTTFTGDRNSAAIITHIAVPRYNLLFFHVNSLFSCYSLESYLQTLTVGFDYIKCRLFVIGLKASPLLKTAGTSVIVQANEKFKTDRYPNL
jgi:hypothetical protein